MLHIAHAAFMYIFSFLSLSVIIIMIENDVGLWCWLHRNKRYMPGRAHSNNAMQTFRFSHLDETFVFVGFDKKNPIG